MNDGDATRDAPECARVLPLSTLFLDERLPSALRGDVEAHLRDCARCRGEYRAHARLAARVQSLPRDAVAADLGARVRALAAPARPRILREAWGAWKVAAALLLVLVGAGGAWLAGVRHGRTLATREARVNRLEVPVVDVAREVALGRVARSLLSDVAAIDQVDARVRRPLLAAQIRQFGLDEWAARDRGGRVDGAPRELDAALASLVRKLESALARSDDAALLELRRDVLASEAQWRPSSEAPRELGPHRPPPLSRTSSAAVADTFADLARDDRVELAHLLDLKESWARGDLAPGVEVARSGDPSLRRSPLAPAFRTTLLFTTAEAGEQRLADAIAGELDQTLKKFLADMQWIDFGTASTGISIGFKVERLTVPREKSKPKSRR